MHKGHKDCINELNAMLPVSGLQQVKPILHVIIQMYNFFNYLTAKWQKVTLMDKIFKSNKYIQCKPICSPTQ